MINYEVILMDEKIVSLLNKLLEGQENLNLKINKIEKKLDSVMEQTEDLTKIKSMVSGELENVEDNSSNFGVITTSKLKDITKFKIVK